MRYTKKLPYTDAAEDAFHFFFAHPHYIEEILCRETHDKEVKHNGSGMSDPTVAEVIRREQVLSKYAAKVAKWQAAGKAIRALEREPDGRHKVAILRAAYDSPFNKGVTNRVRWAALQVPVSETTAWDWIAKALKHWAKYRGLID